MRCARGCCGARRRRSGCQRDFVIYDSSDQVAVVKQALQRAGHRRQARAAAHGARRGSARRRTAWRVRTRCAERWNIRDEQIAKVYEQYILRAEGRQRARLRRPAAEDGRAVRERRSRSRKFYANKFRYVMVDEYQDTNRPQYLLIRRLAEAHRNLAVVGDPDQSIYKWRGADLQEHPRLRAATSPKRRSSGSSRTTARRR